MSSQTASAFLCLLAATDLSAQAVSEWRTPAGLPVVIVELAGGDVEHLAAFVPPGTPPVAIAGFPVIVTAVRGGLLLEVTVPTVLATQVAGELAAVLGGLGAAAVVALGPVPARELQALETGLLAVPFRSPPRPTCVLAEGGVELVRGSPERLELRLALPGPEDARFQLLPAWAAWVQERLQADFPAAHATVEFEDGCSHLVIRLSAEDEQPRELLRRLREALARLAAASPAAEETAKLETALQRRLAVATGEGAGAARELATRVAFGGRATAAFVAPFVDPAALARLSGELLVAHPGFATLVEAERRPLTAERQTLDNGTLLARRFLPGETGIVAVALGAIDPEAAKELLATAANRAAGHGWLAVVTELPGVPALAVATPQGEVVAAEELLADALATGSSPPADGGLAADVAHALGLRRSPVAESVSVALSVPPESEVATEAAVKFFSTLAPGGVRSAPVSLGPGLAWRQGEGQPELSAIVDLPASLAGLVAGQLLVGRLAAESGIRTRWLVPPGRLVLEIHGEGSSHVPALDARLAKLWEVVRRPPREGEAATAARALAAALFGDAAQATARSAAAPFFPVATSAEELLALDPAAVGAALAALPAWDALPRLARGPAPALASPPPRRDGVRKSPPRRP